MNPIDEYRRQQAWTKYSRWSRWCVWELGRRERQGLLWAMAYMGLVALAVALAATG